MILKPINNPSSCYWKIIAMNRNLIVYQTKEGIVAKNTDNKWFSVEQMDIKNLPSAWES